MSVPCRGCAEPIEWARTDKNDRWTPINAEPDPAGNLVVVDVMPNGTKRVRTLANAEQGGLFAETRYMPHHATCSSVGQFRKKKTSR